VFNQFLLKNGRWTDLSGKGVDTGMGLERISAVMQEKGDDIFETDLFLPILDKLKDTLGLVCLNEGYKGFGKSFIKPARIIVDHLRGAVFLVMDGVRPSKEGEGAVLRRILRSTFEEIDKLKGNRPACSADRKMVVEEVVSTIVDYYGEIKEYKNLSKNREMILRIISDEISFTRREIGRLIPKINKRIAILNRYPKNLDLSSPSADLKWLKAAFINYKKDNISIAAGKFAYHLWNTYRYSKETFWEEISEDLKKRVSKDDFEKGYEEGKVKFKEISRKGLEKKFKGGLADQTKATTKLHTATHLLLAALRKVLGKHVEQRGSNINPERLRFDFSHPEKVTPEEQKKVENLVNAQIKKGIEVKCEEMSPAEAKKKGATGVFDYKYGDKVKVYTIDEFSKEICGGPHVKNTSELGRFRILKEESSSAGVRRIKAILE